MLNAFTFEPIPGAQVSGGGASVQTDATGAFLLENIRMGTNNNPWLVNVTASAEGFLTQTKAVTVFCGAAITLDFGRPA